MMPGCQMIQQELYGVNTTKRKFSKVTLEQNHGIKKGNQ